MQDWAFGEAKAAAGPWRAERGCFWANGAIVGAAQIMICLLPLVGGGLVWINRGRCGARDPTNARTPGRPARRFARALGIGGALPARRALPIEGRFNAPGSVHHTLGWASARVDHLAPPADALRAHLQ